MKYVDVHAHIDRNSQEELGEEYGKRYDEWIQQLIEHSKQAGVKAIIANATNPRSNREILDLAQEHDMVKVALGFYPNEVEKVSVEELDAELEFISGQDIVAIGEVGLDKKYAQEKLDDGSWEALYAKQVEGFVKFIELAKKMNKPIIIHSRKAELDVIELLEKHKAKKVVMHCFCGKKKLVQRVIDNGWSFSVPVTVIKLQQFQDMVKATPLSQLLTETDTPFLGPEPGPTNEPANIVLSVEKMAEIKGITKEEMADQLYLNYMRMFQ